MDELISKKDLLDLTEISYGQLYRWKRKNIIPEEWFIKKASYTGQETYFPKDKILERIDKIKEMKDKLSLDELADMFSAKPANINISKEDLMERGILSQRTINMYEEVCGCLDKFDFDNILIPYILEALLKSGEITFDEGKSLILMLKTLKPKQYDCKVILIRKFGVGFWLAGEINGEFMVDEDCKIVIQTFINKFVEQLKLKIEG